MEFKPQPRWLPLLRAFVVFSVIGLIFFGTIHGLNVESTFLTLSPYGLFVGLRTIIQLIGSMLNNRQVEHMQRRAIIGAIQDLLELQFTRTERFYLLNMHDFRSFKRRLLKKHLWAFEEYVQLTDTDLYPFIQQDLEDNANEEPVSEFSIYQRAYWQKVVHRTLGNAGFTPEIYPPAAAVSPTYGPPDLADVVRTIKAAQRQTYPRIEEILLAFNQPDNVEMQTQIGNYVTQSTDPRLGWVNLERASKRHAMFAGFDRHINKFYEAIDRWQLRRPNKKSTMQKLIMELHSMKALTRALIDPWLNMVSINIDGDTKTHEDAVFLGVLQLILDHSVVAITSNVEISNANVNFLTKLTEVRYRYANVVERGYQSLMKTVRCMSGPLMIFWTYALVAEDPRGKKIIVAWLNETFLGVVVGPGDDRSLTVRFNEVGFGVAFNVGIFTETDAPISWSRWIKQQLRWLRSSNRNFIISLKFEFKLPILIIFDDLYLFIFPLLLLLIFVGLAVSTVQVAINVSVDAAFNNLVPYVIVVGGLNLIKAFQMCVSQRSWRYMLLSTYFLLHIRYLVWLRLWSFPTITDSNWLGRTAADLKADQVAMQDSHNKPPPPNILSLVA